MHHKNQDSKKIEQWSTIIEARLLAVLVSTCFLNIYMHNINRIKTYWLIIVSNWRIGHRKQVFVLQESLFNKKFKPIFFTSVAFQLRVDAQSWFHSWELEKADEWQFWKNKTGTAGHPVAASRGPCCPATVAVNETTSMRSESSDDPLADSLSGADDSKSRLQAARGAGPASGRNFMLNLLCRGNVPGCLRRSRCPSHGPAQRRAGKPDPW
jgi:hypothetical protein